MWNQTARYPDLFGLDARAIIPFAIWFLHWSMTTFYIAIAGIFFFWLALRRGDSPFTFSRKIINRIMREDRSSIEPVIYRRRCHW